MASSIVYSLLLLQILCLRLVASQYILGTANTNYYISGTGFELPGDPVQIRESLDSEPPLAARALVLYPPLKAGGLSAIYDRYSGLFIAPYDAGSNVKLAWNPRPFLWRLEKVGDESYAILHPESDEFFWYQNLEIPENIVLGYKASSTDGGDIEWKFRPPESYY
ncbi:hypothetical protein AX14_013164 [Amanita brunnescens Koide BX004]|nr:hypothetical protein AX14_013164 [Amanita brunnescens Koide BX004]